MATKITDPMGHPMGKWRVQPDPDGATTKRHFGIRTTVRAEESLIQTKKGMAWLRGGLTRPEASPAAAMKHDHET